MPVLSAIAGSALGLYLATFAPVFVGGYLFYHAPTTVPLHGIVRVPEHDRESFIFAISPAMQPVRIRYDELTTWSALSLLSKNGVVVGATVRTILPSSIQEGMYGYVHATIDRVGIKATNGILIENL